MSEHILGEGAKHQGSVFMGCHENKICGVGILVFWHEGAEQPQLLRQKYSQLIDHGVAVPIRTPLRTVKQNHRMHW